MDNSMESRYETIQVTVAGLSFRNDENGYSVIRITRGR